MQYSGCEPIFVQKRFSQAYGLYSGIRVPRLTLSFFILLYAGSGVAWNMERSHENNIFCYLKTILIIPESTLQILSVVIIF